MVTQDDKSSIALRIMTTALITNAVRLVKRNTKAKGSLFTFPSIFIQVFVSDNIKAI